MNFRRKPTGEPEINLIPFIDVLLVVLIFLMLSTTYSKFTELQLRLPVADTDPQRDRPREIVVGVARNGEYTVDREPVPGRTVESLTTALRARVRGAGKDPVLVISADASATHQSVVSVMESARQAGLAHIAFAAQSSATGSSGR